MKKQPNNYRTLRLFWSYTKRYQREFTIGSAGAIVANIVQSIIPPFVIAKTFSKLQIAYARHQQLRLGSFTPYLITYAVAMLVGALVWRVQSYFVWELETKVQRDLAKDIYDHLQAQSQRFHADHFAGALVSQTNKLLGSYERLTDDLIWNIIPGLTTLVVGVGVLVFISPMYALVLSIIAIFYIAIMSRRVRKQLPYNVAQAAQESKQTAALADAISNMSTVRSFAQESHESTLFANAVNKVFNAYHKLSIEVMKTEAISHFQTNGFQIIAVAAGLIAVTRYGASASVLYLVISYTQNIVNQLWQFSRIVRNVNRSFGDSFEMVEILNITPEVQDPIEPVPSRIHRGAITFSNVSFFYPENQENPLFEGLDLKIKPGEKVGLVGSSGGGKTTITRLLLRFMDIQEGQIQIDGQNIAEITQHDLRSHIAYVTQEPVLFHRSIADNIRYGDLTASDKAIHAVAKLAHAHEFIEALPKGYETFVGERGVKLSGGQRQRVAIARAMLKNAPILLLDEATSALDSESEALIQDALWKLMEGRTAIVIAHRLSTIQKMDRIIVLDDGKIVEQGSHKELLARKGNYAKLWTHQSGGFIDE
jgi:ATP-binding cassette subfamily B protein